MKRLLLIINFICLLNICRASDYPLLPPEAFPKDQRQNILEGYEKLVTNDFISARQFFQGLLNSKAKGPALYYLAQTFLRIGQIDRAYNYLTHLQELGNDYSEAFRHGTTAHNIALGNYFLRRQNWESALQAFQKALKETPYRKFQDYVSELYIERSHSLNQEKHGEWSAFILKQALSLNPEHENCLEELCTTLLKENNFNEVEPFLERLCQLYPSKTRKFSLALVHTYTNRIQDSFEILKQLHREYPNDREITEKYQQIQNFLNLRETAGHEVEVYKKHNETQEKHNEKILFQIRKLILEQKWSEAEEAISQGRKLFPDNWPILAEQSSYYRLRNMPKKALELLQEKQERFERSFDYQLERILCLEKADIELATRELLLLIASPTYSLSERSQFRKILGRIYLKTGRLESARNLFEMLLEQDIENRDDILFYLGMYHTQSQYFQKSIEYYEQAHKLKPENPRYLLALATSFRQLGHNEEANKYLRILTNSHPESRYTDYALKIFQDFRRGEEPTKSMAKTDEIPIYLAFSALSGKIKLSDEKIINILENTNQWDQLIYFLEQKNATGPENNSHILKLEKIYKDYLNLDFSYTIPAETLLEKLKKLNSENQEQEVIDFSEFVNPHVVFSTAVLEEIAKSAISLRKYEKAVEIYQNLLSNGTNKTKYYSKIGYAYFMLNQLEKSLDAYYSALSYNPANPDLLFKLAELLKTTGEITKARMIYEEIVQLNIDPQSVKDARFFLSQLKHTDG